MNFKQFLTEISMTPTQGFKDFEYGELKRGTEYKPIYFDNIQDLIGDMKFVERIPQRNFEDCLIVPGMELYEVDEICDIIFIRMSCIKKIIAFYSTTVKCYYGDVSFEDFKKKTLNITEEYAGAPIAPALSPVNQQAVSDTATASEKSNAHAQSATDLEVIKDCYADDECEDCGEKKSKCKCVEKLEEDFYNISEDEALLFLEKVSKTPLELKSKKRDAKKKKKELIKKIGMGEFNKRMKLAKKKRNLPANKLKTAKALKKYKKSAEGKKAERILNKRQGMFN